MKNTVKLLLMFIGIILVYIKIPKLNFVGLLLLFSAILAPLFPVHRRHRRHNLLDELEFTCQLAVSANCGPKNSRIYKKWELMEMVDPRRRELVRRLAIRVLYLAFVRGSPEPDPEIQQCLSNIVKEDPNEKIREEAQKRRDLHRKGLL